MKTFLLFFLHIFFFFSISCDDESFLVGDQNVDDISHVIFSVTSYTPSSTRLEGRGTMKNIGSRTIFPPWFIEGHFYSDSTLSLKLGGDRQEKTISLEPGTTINWTLVLSSGNIDESLYPNFKISQLRAYREE